MGGLGDDGATHRTEATMFTAEEREHVRQRILALAQADARVTGGALTGSLAFGSGDGWSDIDVAFGIAEGVPLEVVLDEWTAVLRREFDVVDHFDLHAGPSIYRVFLLPSGLEVDVAVTPTPEFGARGPHFRLLFGMTHPPAASPPANAASLIGLGWHHVLHARTSIERRMPWQAEYWISGIRDHALALACLRLGEPHVYGKGIDRLPAAITAPLSEALVRSLEEQELRRALAAATRGLLQEVAAWDGELSTRLPPVLHAVADLDADGAEPAGESGGS